MKRPVTAEVPTYDAMLIPTIQALQALGGSGTIDEIYERVIELLALSGEVLDYRHGDSSQSEVAYRLAWSRTYLKKVGLIENSARAVWVLTDSVRDINKLDPAQIVKTVREASRTKETPSKSDVEISTQSDIPPEIESRNWQDELHKVVLSLSPDAFERLIQRLLRESGFIHVEITGKSGDGGIDGIGIARINGFLSFHILFQCRRYQQAIVPSQIRDFRGAMQGRTDKGLFITTSSFTREAIKEATRDGAPPIDLIDGDHLVERLKSLCLGVRIQMVESVQIDKEWYARI